jgi:type II secretory pathway component PulM
MFQQLKLQIRERSKLVHKKIEPYLDLATQKWQSLQPREQHLVAILGGAVLIFAVSSLLTGVIKYKENLQREVNSLAQFTLYAHDSAFTYKAINKIQANSFNQVNLDQAKGDVSQIFQLKNPDILIQDGQMTISLPNVDFNEVMLLLEQFRRSYALFPSQIYLTRGARSGFVALHATFGVQP